MTESRRSNGLGAVARVSAIAASVMDLHIKIALQEADREKRRLISGGVFLLMGGVLMFLALITCQVALGFWMYQNLGLNVIHTTSVMALVDIFLAGLSLRIGGHLAKAPYLPETIEGLARTTKAVLGR